jgi:hypothetical protein
MARRSGPLASRRTGRRSPCSAYGHLHLPGRPALIVTLLSRVAKQVGGRAGFDDLVVEGEPVDGGGAEAVAGEGLGPAGGRLVGGDGDRGLFLVASDGHLIARPPRGIRVVVCVINFGSQYAVGWGTLTLINAGLAQTKDRSGPN